MQPVLLNALNEAGKIQIENFTKSHKIEQKESMSSIVTETDLLCDRAIIEIIKSSFPSHNILSEESGLTDNHSKFTWVIDPLDGTSNFAAGIPWFGVLIAVFEGDLPILAGANLPEYNSIYFAESEKGAFHNNKVLRIKKSRLKDELVAFSSDFTNDKEFLEKGMLLYRLLLMNSRNIRSTNSLVDFMMVAENKLGGVVNMYTKIWDIAVPWLIIKEAGGMLKHISGKQIEFDLRKEGTQKNYPVMGGSTAYLEEIEGLLSDN
jgi:myo-inositol-1(or 4)-monophosphatase